MNHWSSSAFLLLIRSSSYYLMIHLKLSCLSAKQVFRNSINELHHSLSISQKRWKDIAMNFITELSLSENYNIICIIICHLIKECHYVFCHWKDNDISVKEIIWIMLWNVYRLHDLLSSIVSNRDSQFIFIIWKSLCKQLQIITSLFTAYHSEINN